MAVRTPFIRTRLPYTVHSYSVTSRYIKTILIYKCVVSTVCIKLLQNRWEMFIEENNIDYYVEYRFMIK